MLKSTMSRLAILLDEELAAVRGRNYAALDGLSHRKAQLLLEISRLSKGVVPDEETQAQLRSLKAKLDENMRVLGIYLEAGREIADLVAESAALQHSDGTYSAPGAIGGGARE